MANELRDAVRYAWRKFENPTLPSPGTEHEPAKEDIFAFGDVLQGEFDDLKSGQSAGQVVAGTWSELAGYPTDEREDGDYGKVVGADAGTHTDPVVGGTVDNRGVYRWSSSPAGWKRIADLDADDADASADRAEEARDEAIAAATSVRAPAGMHTSGMLRQWLFDERVGDTVENILNPGTGDIDLTLATEPNVEWTSKGVKLTDGLMQTGTITGAHTVAVLYRIKQDDVNFIVSGGEGPENGITGQQVAPSYSIRIASGQGIAPIAAHTTGEGAWRLNRGGWVLIFIDFNADYSTALGLGGQIGSTDFRAEEIEFAWAGVWDDSLSDAEREQVFLAVRGFAVRRGIYLHWADCPDYIDCVRFLGQSGVTGYSLISEITDAFTQTRTQPCDSVLVSHLAGSGGEWRMTERFQFKYNHRAQGLLGGEIQSKMGPMPGAAFAHEDNHAVRGRRMLICQSAQDSTSITINPPHYDDSRTWNAGTAKTGGLLWVSMRHWWTIEQYLLSQGIGPRLRACWYFQGEEDGQSFSITDTWQDDIQDLWDAEKLYMGAPDYVMKLIKTGPLGRPPYGTTNGMVEAKIEEVRAAQEAFAAANADVELIDCDDLPLDANEHWNGQGSYVMGQRLYWATTSISEGN